MIVRRMDEQGIGMFVGISGVKVDGEIDPEILLKKVREIASSHEVIVQLFDPDMVAGWLHVLHSTLNALYGFKSKRTISKRKEVEILLYLSGDRRIDRAIKNFGLKRKCRFGFVVISDDMESILLFRKDILRVLDALEDDGILELDDTKVSTLKEFFNIDECELESFMASGRDLKEALRDAIIERTSLLTIEA
ncbi:MAG: KEOPS complex subunit Cgi121 [Candidatus Asgardarchaeia archaeon]